MDAIQDDETTVSIFKDRTLSSYRIISRRMCLSTLILDTTLGNIYTFLFGSNGRRGLRTFQFTSTALSGMIIGHYSSNKEVSITTISSSLTVLDQLIEINQSGQVIEGFTAIVEKNLVIIALRSALVLRYIKKSNSISVKYFGHSTEKKSLDQDFFPEKTSLLRAFYQYNLFPERSIIDLYIGYFL